MIEQIAELMAKGIEHRVSILRYLGKLTPGNIRLRERRELRLRMLRVIDALSDAYESLDEAPDQGDPPAH